MRTERSVGARRDRCRMSVLPLPPSEDGLITYRAARAAGLEQRDLTRLVRAGQLVRIRRGVYTDADHWESLDEFRSRPLLRVRAALHVLRCRDYVLSHDSAAIALGMGVPDARSALVHVTRRKVHGDAERAGIKHHLAPFHPRQVVMVEGMPVLNIVRTALDLGREHGLTAGVAGCDFALRHGATRAELEAAREAMWCWPGSRVMAAAIEMADAGAESWLESAGRVLVRGLGIGRPQTQFGLRAGGRTVWCDMRVGRHVFEVDGRLKYTREGSLRDDPEQALWDEKKRQDFITGFKLGVSRITAVDLGAGRVAAERRLRREYADTCARFGTDVTDLAAYLVTRRRPAA